MWTSDRAALLPFSSRPAGELFAQAPVREYPGVAVETVSDSSRYFVLRIQDDNGEAVREGVRVHRCVLAGKVTRACVRRSQRVHRRRLRGPRRCV